MQNYKRHMYEVQQLDDNEQPNKLSCEDHFTENYKVKKLKPTFPLDKWLSRSLSLTADKKSDIWSTFSIVFFIPAIT